MSNPIRIAIVEDTVELGDALKDVINEESDLVCTQIYRNAEDAIDFLPKNPPDIVVMDIGLPRLSGIDALAILIPELPDTHFCMYTIYEDDYHVFNALQSGAKGYILKNSAFDRTLDALRELHRGGSPMSPSIARQVIDAFHSAGIKAHTPELPLTDREGQLLALLATGLLYKEIAAELSITIGTVKQHIHKIYGKLHVANRTEAINKYQGRY